MKKINYLKCLDVISVILLFAIFSYNIYEIAKTLFFIRNSKEANDVLNVAMNANYVGTIFFTLIFLSVRNFKLWFFPLIWGLGFFCVKIDLFDSIIHNFLINHHLHPMILIENNPAMINPQMDKVLISSLLFFICFVCMFFKKFRNFDRIIFFTVIGSIIATTYFFHFLVAHQLTVKDSTIMMNTIGHVIVADKNESVLKELKVSIFTKENTDSWNIKNFKIVNNGYLDEFPSNALEIAHVLNDGLKQSQRPMGAQMFFNNVANKGNFILFVAPGAITSKFYILTEQINSMVLRDQIWFFLLCLMAHTTWFFGGIFVWWYHKNKFFKKRKTAVINQAI